MIPKFRAWDKHGQKMFANDELIIWNGNVYANDSKKLTCNNLKGWSIDDEYLMQSTGLFDKKGVEIFEGDVVSAGTATRVVKKNNLLGFYIEEGEKIGYFSDVVDVNCLDFFAKDFGEEAEIIGNIYENPELLEDNK